MILLSNEAASAFDDLKVPPTHAILVHRKHNIELEHEFPTATYTRHTTVPEIYVIYAFCTVDADGNAILTNRLDPVECIVDMNEPHFDHLNNGGVVPHPDDISKPMDMPAKTFGDMKVNDIDAVIAATEPRLAGTVAPNPIAAPTGNGLHKPYRRVTLAPEDTAPKPMPDQTLDAFPVMPVIEEAKLKLLEPEPAIANPLLGT